MNTRPYKKGMVKNETFFIIMKNEHVLFTRSLIKIFSRSLSIYVGLYSKSLFNFSFQISGTLLTGAIFRIF